VIVEEIAHFAPPPGWLRRYCPYFWGLASVCLSKETNSLLTLELTGAPKARIVSFPTRRG
jgi:hypothetical protein